MSSHATPAGPAADAAPGPLRRWVLGARPRTLPASVAPVVVGTAAASVPGPLVWWRAVAAVVVALALQVATNYANDYSDGVRGTDHARVGPLRLVASGTASPAAVKRAALVAFGVAAVAGGALALATTLWMLAVGAAAIAAGWFYTGGPRPYGYAGLGEVFVFVFFGLVATAGSSYVHHQQLTLRAVVAGVAMGCLSCALLVVNNLRDIPTDRAAGKRTLAVRLGDHRTRQLYVGLVGVAFAAAVLAALVPPRRPLALVALVAAGVAARPVGTVRAGAAGRELVPALGATARVLLVMGAGLALGFAVA